MSGFCFESVEFVLNEPMYPENIGYVARAIKNMGFSRLGMINPEAFPHPKAYYRAVHASDILDQAVLYNGLDEALAQSQFVIATSARLRRLPTPMLSLRDAGALIAEKIQGPLKVVILFGREDHGLPHEILLRANRHLVIPANPDYPILNLAQAVQLVAYSLFESQLKQAPVESQILTDRQIKEALPANGQSLSKLFELFEKWLQAIDFSKQARKRTTMVSARLQQLVTRKDLTQVEVDILIGLLKKTLIEINRLQNDH